MGAWGIGVWQDDVAQDVIVLFQDLRREGCSATEAVQRALENPLWRWDDEEDSARQVLAIAALALQQGVMEPSLRNRTLATIDSGVSLWPWESAQTEIADARKTLLSRFRELVLKGSATDEDFTSVTAPNTYSL
jgi:hypothetical protein